MGLVIDVSGTGESADARGIEKAYWNRSGFVAIQDRTGNMVRYGGPDNALDFRFSGTKVGDISRRFKVGILGLSLESIKSLTQWDKSQSVMNPRRIQVFAGYDFDSLNNPIFDGYVFTAIPTSPPEMWLEFECVPFLKNTSPIKSPGLVKDKAYLIFKKLAELLNLKVPERLYLNTALDREIVFLFDGSAISMIHDFANQTNGIVYHEGGILFWVEKNSWFNETFVYASSSVVSSEYGMIGIPKVDYKGAIIKTRLNDDIPLMKWISLESEIMPSANGYYFVIGKKHVGHLRGDDWYTELETVRKR